MAGSSGTALGQRGGGSEGGLEIPKHSSWKGRKGPLAHRKSDTANSSVLHGHPDCTGQSPLLWVLHRFPFNRNAVMGSDISLSLTKIVLCASKILF